MPSLRESYWKKNQNLWQCKYYKLLVNHIQTTL
jgi:hypothetical protein